MADGTNGCSKEDNLNLSLPYSQDCLDWKLTANLAETKYIKPSYPGDIVVPDLSPFNAYHSMVYSHVDSPPSKGFSDHLMESVSPKSLCFADSPSFPSGRIDTVDGLLKVRESPGTGQDSTNEWLRKLDVNLSTLTQITKDHGSGLPIELACRNQQGGIGRAEKVMAIGQHATDLLMNSPDISGYIKCSSASLGSFQPETESLGSDLTNLIDSFFSGSTTTPSGSTEQMIQKSKSPTQVSADKSSLFLGNDLISRPVKPGTLEDNPTTNLGQISEKALQVETTFSQTYESSRTLKKENMRRIITQGNGSSSAQVSGMNILDLPRISHTPTTDFTFDSKVPKRKLSEEETTDVFISLRAKNYSHFSYQSRGKFCAGKPLSIPSTPMVPELTTSKLSLTNSNHRFKPECLKKAFH